MASNNNKPDAVTEVGALALIAVEKAMFSFDRLYTYVIPNELIPFTEAGKRVSVPFGLGSKKVTGMVFETTVGEYEPQNIKKVSLVLDEEPYMTREMLDLAKWLKENTFCTYYNAVRCILPPVLRDFKGDTPFKGKVERVVGLADGFDADLTEINFTPKQKSVIETLKNNTASIKEVCYLCGITPAVVNTLIKKGVVEAFEAETADGDADYTENKDIADIVLTDEQQRAFAALTALADSDEPKCALLHGITGSGKTSVFLKLVGEVLRKGRTALILVPEISLTPQTIAIFKGFFGENAAVIHSRLSREVRTKEYKRIRDKSAQIVIGTRSAVFSPLENIGLIVIDEEGEHTYKSDRSPRYHVRDIAKQRCFRHKALLLLASATPSIDSYRNAVTGKYALLELNQRYSGNSLPEVNIVDMKAERLMNENSPNANDNFSNALLDGLRQNLDKGEQSLILLNRRGYYTFVCCIACGEVSMCPHCGVPLTYHSDIKYNQNRLSCHYCGYIKSYNDKCDKCGSHFIKQTGTGTQRIEDELQTLFPDARILRMDADTTITKGAYERGFGSFGNREYDIMVGTQMIAKGLDFPNVTLVGILLIDNSLYAGDFQGYERTFSLITQVVGRAGRGDKTGKAFLQTFTPEHYVLRLASRQDYKGFYEEEAAIREATLFPPFCDLCVVEVCNVIEKNAFNAAKAFLGIFDEKLRKAVKIPIRVLGPVKHGVGSINGRFRYRLIIKCKNSPAFRKVMSEALIQAQHSSKGSVKVFDSCRVSAWFE